MGKALVMQEVSFQTNALTQVTFGGQIPCTALSLSPSSVTFESFGETQTVVATPTPSNTTDLVTWTSSDENVASVVDGVITLNGLGTTTITATCGTISQTITITQSSAAISNVKLVSGKYCDKRSDDYPTIVLYNSSGNYTVGQEYNEADTTLHVEGGDQQDVQTIRVPYGATRLGVTTTDSSDSYLILITGDPNDLVLYNDAYWPKFLSKTRGTKVSNLADVVPGQCIIIRYGELAQFEKVTGITFSVS